MNYNNKSIQQYVGLSALALCLLLTSCKKFTEIGAPPTQVLASDVFTTDLTASGAIMGLYTGNVATQILVPYTMYPGMSADDVQYNTPGADYDGYETNTVSINNALNGNAWYYAYQYLRNINYDIAGLTASTTLTPSVKDQLMGEAKFLRAFVLFELVNFYGDVPMPLGNNDLENAFLPRTAAKDVWGQIVADLKDAQSLLVET